MAKSPETSSSAPSDFLREIVAADVAAGKYGGAVVTRFPPEPNGFPHIGHAKSICLNFGIAQEMGGRCHLRMDDTNPTTEDVAYVEAIKRDVAWLGFEWGEHFYHASDYFERFYELGEKLIRLGRAYICDLSEEDFSTKYRGTISEAGKESPYRARSVEENLDLFRRMRKGEFPDGAKVLRARIDMTSPNMKMRDPPLVRIKHAHHYRTGDAWCLYPLYDFAHCLEDSFEGVTHSICTMEFESARELYDWVIQATEVPHVPHQYEFARLNLTYTVMSKRKLQKLVEGKHVAGWDDPRMPTISGLRRRGYTAASIREFCARIGVAKNLSTVDVALLESCLREDLDARSPRVMCVQRPLELLIESLPEDHLETLVAPYWPEGSAAGDDVPSSRRETRELPLSRRVFIERDDFAEIPPKGWKRLAPGGQVRLRHAYVVTCTRVEKDERGEIVRVVCTHDPASRSGAAKTPGADPPRALGTIHWVDADRAKDVEVRLYDRLFRVPRPGEVEDGEAPRDWLEDLNPSSLEIVRAKAEPSLGGAEASARFQFERLGFYVVDEASAPGAPVFNRTVSLKDGWARVVRAAAAPPIAIQAPKIARKSVTEADMLKVTSPAGPQAKRMASAAVEAIAYATSVKKLVDAHGVTADEGRVLAQEPSLGALFESAVVAADDPSLARPIASTLVNMVLGELRARRLAAAPFDGAALAELVVLAQRGTISSQQQKDVLAEMFASGRGARAIVESSGLKQIANEGELGPIVDAVLAKNADAVARYKAGNANVFGALVGMVMKETKGQGNPRVVSDLLKSKLA